MFRKLSLAAGAAVATMMIAACGGGNDTPAASTLEGTAAVGAPIVDGIVNVVCAGGAALTSSPTSSTGGWQVTLSGHTLPCAVRVSGGTVGGAAHSGQYHSVAMTLGRVNITPLTDLVFANLVNAAPSTWFSGVQSSHWSAITQARVNTALGNVSTALGLSTALGSTNPLTATFSPVNGDVLDDILEALAAAGAQHANLLTLARASTFSAPQGFNFSSAYTTVRTANAGSTGGSCTTGQTALTYATTSASSGPHTNGQQVCFTLSTTSLAFSGKTLGSPTLNTHMQAPYSGYIFADGSNSYEVIFNSSALHEINVSVGSQFHGQFAAPAVTPPSGTSSLTVSVNVSGIASPSIVVGNVPTPASESEFCGALQNDSTFSSIGATGGGSLTINSCSFANKVGTVNATLSITSPYAMTVPYTITYTYQ